METRKYKYLQEMEREYRNLQRTLCRFESYDEKLEGEQDEKLTEIKHKFKSRFAPRIQRTVKRWDEDEQKR